MSSEKTQLSLSSEERNALAETLDSVLSDLRYEIADTDSHDFKEGLKAKKQLLEGIVKRLGSG